MRSLILSSLALAAVTLVTPAALTSADAMPVATPIPLAGDAPAVILTSGGCGPFRYRTIYGFCRPNFYRGYGYGYGWHRWGWHRWDWHRHWGWRHYWY